MILLHVLGAARARGERSYTVARDQIEPQRCTRARGKGLVLALCLHCAVPSTRARGKVLHHGCAGICLLDKLALRMDIWTTLHVAHMPTLRRHLAHRGPPFGPDALRLPNTF